MRALLQGAALGALRGADLELAPGRYVVLSSEREPLADLVAVLCGREPPRQGQVLVDGAAPAASPALRRRLAALLPDEALPPAKTVSQSLEKALAARGASSGAAASLLEDAGLARLAALAPAALGARATRSVALALALAHSSAELFALHEPLATLVSPSFVLAVCWPAMIPATCAPCPNRSRAASTSAGTFLSRGLRKRARRCSRLVQS